MEGQGHWFDSRDEARAYVDREFARGARSFDDAGRLRITEPTVRGVALAAHGDAAALRFVYGGATDKQVALASGQVRRQLGLKLRAANGCNVVYVMWRLDPTPMIEVSTKVNPGDEDHGDCGTKGYAKLKAQKSEPPPVLEPGTGHTLSAEIRGDMVLALVDEHVVWRGALDARARTLRGPAGLRTDNVRIDAELLVAPADPGQPRPSIPGCE